MKTATVEAELPATLSNPENCLAWTPSARVHGSGLLRIDTKRLSVSYLVTSAMHAGGYLVVHLVKVDAGSNPAAESYTVTAGEYGPWCDCRGFAFSKHMPRHCKHGSAVAVMIENGWLPNPKEPHAERPACPTTG